MWLHGNETRPAVQICGEQSLGKLPGIHRRRADVAGFAGPHHVIQCFQRFFYRRVIIPAVDLVQVDVICSQALEAGVDRAEDVFAREAAIVGAWAHLKIDLGGDHYLVSGSGKIFQGFADNFFTSAI